jgi:IS30 family transposase
MAHTQLTSEQRYQIQVLLKMGHNQTEIAKCLGVHKSTISREGAAIEGIEVIAPGPKQMEYASERARPQLPAKRLAGRRFTY